jgi:hypothetical protein
MGTHTQEAGPKSSYHGTVNINRLGKGKRTSGPHAGKKTQRASQSAATGSAATMIAAFDRKIAADYPDMTAAEIAAAAAAAIATKRGGSKRRRRRTRTKRSKRGGSRCSSRRVRRR